MSQQPPDGPGNAGSAAPATDAPIGFQVRLGHSQLAPATTMAALRAAIDASNRGFRVEGLPDALNPDVIDPDKAAALLLALPTIARKSPQLLAGRELLLTHGPLQIGSADPTTAASFARPFDLEVVDVQGETLLARSTVLPVPEMARLHAAEAREKLRAEKELIALLEARLSGAADVGQQRKLLDDLTPAQWRRSALARAWLINARAVSDRPGAGAAAKAETDAALKAVNDDVLPSGTGMPR